MPPKRKSDATEQEPRRSERATSKPALLLEETGSTGRPTPAKKVKTVEKKSAAKAKIPVAKKAAATAAPAQKKKPAVKKAVAKSKPAAKEKEPAKEEAFEDAAEKEASSDSQSKSQLKVGDLLPHVTLKDETGAEVDVHALAQGSGLVLFSYPAASTPGCTSQACSYRDAYADITEKGFKVLGLSTDTVNAQEKFKKKNNFQYTLLSDPQAELLGPLGGKTSAKKTARRCHWVVQKGGKLAEIALDVKPKDCVSRALKTIEGLGK